MNKIVQDNAIMEDKKNNIVLFYPFIPENAKKYVNDTLSSRWIGQGPRVDLFEEKFAKKFTNGNPTIAVGSGTNSLHLAYLLAGLKKDDEVISTVFTCTATNIPLLYIGANIKLADVQKNTLNIDPEHVERLITKKTKAIVCVHYGGLPCDMKELQAIASKWGIPIIEDAAQALGATYQGKSIGTISDFTTFSLQAIKHITTGDGGMLAFKDKLLLEKAKRMRWFGIDRSAKQKGVWENDIKEIGYKYQMTDISAAMGLAGLEEFDRVIKYRQKLLKIYETKLANVPGITLTGANYKDREHAAWICTVIAENRVGLQAKLREHNIESGQVHYRNDRYSILKKFKTATPNMDFLEDRYLVLPLHMRTSVADIEKVCKVIKSGW